MKEGKADMINVSMIDDGIDNSKGYWYTPIINFYLEYKRIFKAVWISGIFLSLIVLFLVLITFGAPVVQEIAFSTSSDNEHNVQTRIDTNALIKQHNKLLAEVGTLEKKLDKKIPRSVFLIINTSKNTFCLYKYNELIGKGKCSTGSYILLSNGDKQKWIFKTPKGAFSIKGKTFDPVWIKPDWAFVEEGLPIPSATHSSRYEYGVLGDYALSLGHGYMIHGTLYQRFLGLPVTHGCIRLNDEDLKMVYRRLAIGSKVFIY